MQQKEIEALFERVAARLKAQAWFKKDGWKISTHPFPAKKPDAVTFHVYKAHWYNEEREGIHIESFLMLDPKARKKSSITLHVLHHELIPGTRIKRKDLAALFVDSVHDEVSSWDGYEFRAGKYGVQPFTKRLDGTSPEFEGELFEETTRLCRRLGPEIDKALKRLLAPKKT